MKTILVAGATGQTGRLVVEQSLANDHKVRIIVRSCNRLPAEILEHPNINLVEASELDLSDEQIVDLVKGMMPWYPVWVMSSVSKAFLENQSSCVQRLQNVCAR